MLALKYLLMMCGLGMIVAAVCILTYDLYREMLYRRAIETRIIMPANRPMVFQSMPPIAAL